MDFGVVLGLRLPEHDHGGDNDDGVGDDGGDDKDRKRTAYHTQWSHMTRVFHHLIIFFADFAVGRNIDATLPSHELGLV